MTYSETLDFLYEKLPMFTRIGSAAIKKDLTNTIAICKELGNPHQKFKSIHIAGTNGKGSVSHMLAAILQTAGYKTGLYTSPHLYDFRERIKINGMMVPEEWVIQFVEKVKPLIETIEPSFFEITVAMAFSFFADEKIDVAIVETGLGGRLDSTNIVLPELSIITNIGYDHMNILGNSLQEIASEKAGIIKQNIPVVVGEKKKETEEIFIAKAKEKNAEIFFAENDIQIESFQTDHQHLSISVKHRDQDTTTNLKLDLPGIYQLKNVVTVLKSVDVLKSQGWSITNQHVITALKNVKGLTGLFGRWEVLQTAPTVVLEVAHNEDGIRQMIKHLEQISYNNLHLVFGMVKDKEINKVLELLPKKAAYYFTQAQIPRALDKTVLRSEARNFGLNGDVFDNVNIALTKALQKATPDDLIIICGSIFLVAEVKRPIKKTDSRI